MDPETDTTEVQSGFARRAVGLLLPIFLAPLLVCMIAAALLWLVGPAT